MALVDYDSNSDASESDRDDSTDPGPASKKQKLSTPQSSDLPPLPPGFHDLYASTVRLSNTDDPSLHQGRKRQIPHKPGNWPSHLYIEWHPKGSEHDLLGSILSHLSERLASPSNSDATGPSSTGIAIRDFLTSDLGAPLPLHISLSRPLSLTTGQKGEFLDRLRDAVSKCGLGEFELTPTALEWHRTYESSRSFLVLRVVSSAPPLFSPAVPVSSLKSVAVGKPGEKNPELGALLRHCNTLCKTFEQPELYAFSSGVMDLEGGHELAVANAENAFHVSLAWSFAEPTEGLRQATKQVFEMREHASGVKGIRIKVDGIKAKIGNIVTHLPLSATAARKIGSTPEGKGLLEL
ncbi:putative U6 snRNA phosphodiesterase [Seiridium cardinale]|uniref:U6 snRNA phosphodiesterase n=1 Tax=Seiridium cardinale TaxID=138064 RepID=A0ABR2XUN9_9PEZI